MISPLVWNRSRAIRQFLLALLVLVTPVAMGASSTTLDQPAVSPSPQQLEFFERRIRPLLAERCYECHSEGKKTKGGLRLDTRDGWRLGGDSGPALVPGNPDSSLLIRLVQGKDPQLQMPPRNPLSQRQIEDLTEWVKIGAPDPRSTVHPSRSSAEARSNESPDLSAPALWAYRPVNPSPPPKGRLRHEVDNAISAALDRHRLISALPADRWTLGRRLYADLIGLPPDTERLTRFVADDSPDAVERLVDELLASPHFGEHWARRWLDLVRFAESVTLRGFIFKEAWRYRDYVIDAWNQDLPYDAFVREQIAGDLLTDGTLEDRQRRCVATTFLALGNTNLEEQDKKQLELDVIDEQLDVLGKAFLGQTLGCARCHDHKFDPISTRDYYALAGIFKSTSMLKHDNVSAWLEHPLPLSETEEQHFNQIESELKTAQNELAKARKSLAAAKESTNAVAKLSDETSEKSKIKALEAQVQSLTRISQKRPKYMSVREATPVNIPVAIRGNVHSPGPTVQRGFIAALSFPHATPPPPHQSGRLQLASWIASPSNSLTSRVLVNRVWTWLFGAGLAPTPDNFGATGEPPTHPELLDLLAWRFSNTGEGGLNWSLKALIRELALTRTYQQSSETSETTAGLDPNNRLWARALRKRLPAEFLHDALLSASGQLTLYRPSGATYPATLSADYGFQTNAAVRAVYLPVFRNSLPEFLKLFDFADPTLPTGARQSSTVATQALFWLNHPSVRDASRSTARRIQRVHPIASADAWANAAALNVLARPATKEEKTLAHSLLVGLSGEDATDQLANLCHALFASIEFRTLH